MILTDDPVIQRHMNAPRSPFRRGHWYKGMKLDPRVDNLLSERDEVRHTELRAKLMSGVNKYWYPLPAKIDSLIHCSTPQKKSQTLSQTSMIVLQTSSNL